MTLDSFKTIKAVLDTANKRITSSSLIAVAGDHNGRDLEVKITNNGKTADMTGYDLVFYWKHKSIYINGMSKFDNQDAAKGVFTLSFPSDMLRAGLVQATVSIVDGENESIINSRPFTIEVEGSSYDEKVAESSNSFTLLDEILFEWHDLPNKINTMLGETKDKVNAVLDNVSGRLDSINDDIDKKVDKVDGKQLSQENYSTEEKTKLAGLEAPHFKGTFSTVDALTAGVTDQRNGDYAYVGEAGTQESLYIWDSTDNDWVQSGATGSDTPAIIKSKYESNPDTNAYTDADKQTLNDTSSTANYAKVTADNAVPKQAGLELSENSFTNDEKQKLAELKQAVDNGHLWFYIGAQSPQGPYYEQLGDDISQLQPLIEGEDHELTLGDFIKDSGMMYIVDKPVNDGDTKFSASPTVTGMTPQGMQNFMQQLTSDLRSDISDKQDKVDGKGLSTNDFTDELKDKLTSLVTNSYNGMYWETDKTLSSIGQNGSLYTSSLILKQNYIPTPVVQIGDIIYSTASKTLAIVVSTIGIMVYYYTVTNNYDAVLNGKQDREDGKILSTNDFTDAYKTQLDDMATRTVNDSAWQKLTDVSQLMAPFTGDTVISSIPETTTGTLKTEIEAGTIYAQTVGDSQLIGYLLDKEKVNGFQLSPVLGKVNLTVANDAPLANIVFDLGFPTNAAETVESGPYKYVDNAATLTSPLNDSPKDTSAVALNKTGKATFREDGNGNISITTIDIGAGVNWRTDNQQNTITIKVNLGTDRYNGKKYLISDFGKAITFYKDGVTDKPLDGVVAKLTSNDGAQVVNGVLTLNAYIEDNTGVPLYRSDMMFITLITGTEQ